jgi:hypothetical protein
MSDLGNYQQRVARNQDVFTPQEQEQIRSLLSVGEAKCRSGETSFIALSPEARGLLNKLEQAEASRPTDPSRSR